MEPDEGLEKVGDALKICAHFKKLYFEKKSQLSVYFKEQPVVEWNFKSSLIFTRMDMFINQMRLIEVNRSYYTAWDIFVVNANYTHHLTIVMSRPSSI